MGSDLPSPSVFRQYITGSHLTVEAITYAMDDVVRVEIDAHHLD